MAKKRLKIDDRVALEDWKELVDSINESIDIDSTDSTLDIDQRKKKLESNSEEWFRYYFPNYYTCEPANFHIAATKRLLNHDRWYEVRAWARELAKSARSMMEVLFLSLTGKIKNVLLISNSFDNAERLLDPIRANLEFNKRIIQDYGLQQTLGKWESGEFTAKCGCAFRALGAGQSPRGTRSKNIRPDFILIDDIDTDEECLNPDRIKKKWKWLEEALLPAMSVSGKYRILFNGNIIANDCIVKRAFDRAKELGQIGYADKVNIRDNRGKSVWSKNKEEDIDGFLALISTSAGQKEFFNNPLSEGDVFKEMHWGKCPDLRLLDYAIVYGDPAPSNSKNKSSSYKSCFLIGYYKGKFYIYTGYLDRVTNEEFVEWYYSIKEYNHDKTQLYNYIENNSLQDPFYEQVFMPLFSDKGSKKGFIGIVPDERVKPHKFERIEGNLEPLNRRAILILNEDEKGNPNMKRLEEQFLLLNKQMKSPADGPDCIEGGIWIINQKLSTLNQNSYSIGVRYSNNKRF